MTVKLVLNPRLVKHLQQQLGDDRVTILEVDADGFKYVSFEIRHDMDVLSLLHAGNDSGLELGIYGPNGKPTEKVSATVA